MLTSATSHAKVHDDAFKRKVYVSPKGCERLPHVSAYVAGACSFPLVSHITSCC